MMLNDWDLPSMGVLGTTSAGHEGAGVIVKVGDNVKDLKVGMRAGFKAVYDTCGACADCKSGQDSYCLRAKFSGCHVNGKTGDLFKAFYAHSTQVVSSNI